MIKNIVSRVALLWVHLQQVLQQVNSAGRRGAGVNLRDFPVSVDDFLVRDIVAIETMPHSLRIPAVVLPTRKLKVQKVEHQLEQDAPKTPQVALGAILGPRGAGWESSVLGYFWGDVLARS